eukprot:COSAG01_NODE_1673_length_9542_cov_12.825765_15_plen_238_part_00
MLAGDRLTASVVQVACAKCQQPIRTDCDCVLDFSEPVEIEWQRHVEPAVVAVLNPLRVADLSYTANCVIFRVTQAGVVLQINPAVAPRTVAGRICCDTNVACARHVRATTTCNLLLLMYRTIQSATVGPRRQQRDIAGRTGCCAARARRTATQWVGSFPGHDWRRRITARGLARVGGGPAALDIQAITPVHLRTTVGDVSPCLEWPRFAPTTQVMQPVYRPESVVYAAVVCPLRLKP